METQTGTENTESACWRLIVGEEERKEEEKAVFVALMVILMVIVQEHLFG